LSDDLQVERNFGVMLFCMPTLII